MMTADFPPDEPNAKVDDGIVDSSEKEVLLKMLLGMLLVM
jgi:hypothetical protein